MKRMIYHLVWSARFRRWHLISPHKKGTPIAHWPNKEDALKGARFYCKGQVPSQLRVHRKDGRIAFENTYGADPRRYPS